MPVTVMTQCMHGPLRYCEESYSGLPLSTMCTVNSTLSGGRSTQEFYLQKDKFKGVGIDDIVLDPGASCVWLVHQQLGSARRAIRLFQQQLASPQWDDDIVVAVPVPAGLSLGRKAILRDPNVRLLEPDCRDRLCTSAHCSPPVRELFLTSYSQRFAGLGSAVINIAPDARQMWDYRVRAVSCPLNLGSDRRK